MRSERTDEVQSVKAGEKWSPLGKWVTRGMQIQRLIQIHTKPIHVKRDVIEVQRVELHFETKIAVPPLIL